MRYAECPIIDNGFYVFALAGPGDITGLANVVVGDDDQRFEHLGYTGYPAGALMLIDRPDREMVLAVLPTAAALPEGSTEIQAADVPALLVGSYGWPEGSTLVDGLPVRPVV